MAKKYIINECVFEDGTHIYKVMHDVNGNPRYMVHYSVFSRNFDKAKAIANSIGFRKSNNSQFREHFIITSYRGFRGVKKLIDDEKENIG